MRRPNLKLSLPLVLVSLLAGCAVPPQNHLGVSAGMEPANRSAQSVPAPAPVIPSSAADQALALAQSKAHTDAQWTAGQNYIESVVGCKTPMSVKKFSAILGAAASGYNAPIHNKKAETVKFVPNRSLTLFGMPVAGVTLQQGSGMPDQPFVYVSVNTPLKQALATMASHKIAMKAKRGEKGVYSHDYSVGDGEGQELVMSAENAKQTTMICAVVYPD